MRRRNPIGSLPCFVEAMPTGVHEDSGPSSPHVTCASQVFGKWTTRSGPRFISAIYWSGQGHWIGPIYKETYVRVFVRRLSLCPFGHVTMYPAFPSSSPLRLSPTTCLMPGTVTPLCWAVHLLGLLQCHRLNVCMHSNKHLGCIFFELVTSVKDFKRCRVHCAIYMIQMLLTSSTTIED